MKTRGLLLFLLLSIFCGIVSSQPPAFKYQAVARDGEGNILSNQNVSFQFNILKGNSSGSIVFSEIHSTTTNEFGLVSIVIGNGVQVLGDLALINWGDDSYFLNIEMDETGGTNFQVIGTNQILSVPYALYSESINPEGLSTYIGYCSEGVTDYDGNHYRTVKIGNQCWMAENLKSINYSDGSLISTGQYAYENNEHYVYQFGRLYTWVAAMNGAPGNNNNPSGEQGACPEGWHLPSDAEWQELERTIGMDEYSVNQTGLRSTYNEGVKLKQKDEFSFWTPGAYPGTDLYNFTVIPGGKRYQNGSFGAANYEGSFWTTTEGPEGAIKRSFFEFTGGISRFTYHIDYAFSIRCVKD